MHVCMHACMFVWMQLMDGWMDGYFDCHNNSVVIAIITIINVNTITLFNCDKPRTSK